MESTYITNVTATAGRNGTAVSNDGRLNLKLSLPQVFGGKGDATNPEQLFAAGYAACFGNAILYVGRSRGKIADDAVMVTAEVGLVKRNDGPGFRLIVALHARIAGVDDATALYMVAEADKICPYSNAIRGNVEVKMTVEAI